MPSKILAYLLQNSESIKHKIKFLGVSGSWRGQHLLENPKTPFIFLRSRVTLKWRRHVALVNHTEQLAAKSAPVPLPPPQILKCSIRARMWKVAMKCLDFSIKCSRVNGPGSSVDIATAYGLDGPRIESRWGRDFPHLSRPALRPTQPPVQWVPGLY